MLKLFLLIGIFINNIFLLDFWFCRNVIITLIKIFIIIITCVIKIQLTDTD